MILELDRASLLHVVVVGDLLVPAGPEVILAVVGDHTVMNHSDIGLLEQVSFGVPLGRFEDNVVGLPLTGRAAGVYERRLVTVDGGSLAVGIRLVVVGVQHLDLISTEEKDTAVAAALGLLDNFSG